MKNRYGMLINALLRDARIVNSVIPDIRVAQSVQVGKQILDNINQTLSGFIESFSSIYELTHSHVIPLEGMFIDMNSMTILKTYCLCD